MPKQEKLKFDYEDYFNEKLESTAILMWGTHYQTFTFAFYLNQLYGFNLERHENITLERKSGEYSCSLYTYQINANQQAFFLIDNPKETATPNIFDKTLLIIGPESQELAKRIYDDMEHRASKEEQFSSFEREEIRSSFVENGIFESALFDFSDPEYPDTTYFPDTSNNAALQKKRQRFLKEQREYVADLILALDPLLPDYETEDILTTI